MHPNEQENPQAGLSQQRPDSGSQPASPDRRGVAMRKRAPLLLFVLGLLAVILMIGGFVVLPDGRDQLTGAQGLPPSPDAAPSLSPATSSPAELMGFPVYPASSLQETKEAPPC